MEEGFSYCPRSLRLEESGVLVTIETSMLFVFDSRYRLIFDFHLYFLCFFFVNFLGMSLSKDRI